MFSPSRLGATIIYWPISSPSRLGAPFADRLSTSMQHLLEGGLLDHWLDDIILRHSREAVKKKNDEENGHEAIVEVYM